MKKPLLIIIALLVIGIGTALIIKFPSNNITEIPTQDSPLSGDISSTGDIEFTNSGDNYLLSGTIITGANKSLFYINTEYGFQVTLPEGWENYGEFIYRYTGESITARLVIALPTTSPRPGVDNPNDSNLLIPGYTGQYKYITGYADMIGFNIYTHDGYDIAINTPDVIWDKNVRIQHTIGSGINYVYTFVGPTDLPNDLIAIWGDRDYFKPILDSFKVL